MHIYCIRVECMCVWERMCWVGRILLPYCCSLRSGIVFYCRVCTPPFLINWFLQWKTAVPHIMKSLNIYSCYIRYVKLYFPDLEQHWKSIFESYNDILMIYCVMWLFLNYSMTLFYLDAPNVKDLRPASKDQ